MTRTWLEYSLMAAAVGIGLVAAPISPAHAASRRVDLPRQCPVVPGEVTLACAAQRVSLPSDDGLWSLLQVNPALRRAERAAEKKLEASASKAAFAVAAGDDTLGDDTLGGDAMGNPPIDGPPVDGGSVDNPPIEGAPVGGGAVDNPPVGGPPVGGGDIDNPPIGGPPVDGGEDQM